MKWLICTKTIIIKFIINTELEHDETILKYQQKLYKCNHDICDSLPKKFVIKSYLNWWEFIDKTPEYGYEYFIKKSNIKSVLCKSCVWPYQQEKNLQSNL